MNQILNLSKSCGSQCTDTVVSFDNGYTVINLYDIVNDCNDYIFSIPETTKNNMKYLYKPFSNFFLRMSAIVKCFCNLLIKKK